jgi:[acyl-carrier-protein] S-malonyltransferase
VQLLTVERLVERTARELGVAGGAQPELADLNLDQTAELELGSVLTAVLVASPVARSVYQRVTAAVEVDEERITEYYRRNLASLGEPEARLARLLSDRTIHDGRCEQRLGWVVPAQLAGALGRAVAGTAAGQVSEPVLVGGDRWTVAVDEVRPARVPALADVRDRIAAELRDAARRHAFVSWVERARQTRVRLRDGYEHPADPRQPDNTHRH